MKQSAIENQQQPELEENVEVVDDQINNQETAADQAEKLYKEEILPLLDILKPDGVPLEAYDQTVHDQLYRAVRQRQILENRLTEAPQETVREMKEVLLFQLKKTLEDARAWPEPKVTDKNLVKKARIALLYLGDTSDFSKQGVSEEEIEKMHYWSIEDFKKRIAGYEKEDLFSESDLDALMKTKFAKNLADSGGSKYFGDYGVCENIPASLMKALAQSDASSRDSPIEKGLEAAREKQYDLDTLKHLIASNNANYCLRYAEKFEEGAIEIILATGAIKLDTLVEFLAKSDLPEEKKSLCADLFVKNQRGARDVLDYYRRTPANQAFLQKLGLGDAIERVIAIKDDSPETEEDRYEKVKQLISEGYMSLVLSGYTSYKHVKRFMAEEYDEFKEIIQKNNQEHLVMHLPIDAPSLKDEDRVAYAQKLIETGQEHKISWLREDFPAHSLGPEIFYALKEKDFLAEMHWEWSTFKGLPETEAHELIDQFNQEKFLRNIESFDLSQEFLHDPKVQEYCFQNFQGDIRLMRSKEAKDTADKIPFPQEWIEEEAMLVIKKKWLESDEGRVEFSYKTVEKFPFLKKHFNTPEIHKKVYESLKEHAEKGYDTMIVRMLPAFPLPDEMLKTPELQEAVTVGLENVLLRAGQHNNDRFGSLEEIFERIDYIATFIPLPEHIMKMRAVTEEIKVMSTDLCDVRKEISQMVSTSKEPEKLWQHLNSLAEELQAKNIKTDKSVVLLYLSRFKDGGSQEEKDGFFEKVAKDIKSLAQNKPVDPEIDQDYYKFILKQVYHKRNYDSYAHITDYIDRSEDLDKFEFDREGYEIKLSGVVGYRIKEGETTDPELLQEFSKRIQEIKSIASEEILKNFLDEKITNSQAATLEGKILEYFNEHGYTIDTMNVLLAYQLSDSYDTFVRASVDRVSEEENKVSKDYILLDELVDQYGDTMKETIKTIQRKVVKSEDVVLFASDSFEKDKERYQQIGESIHRDLSKIPRDRVTDSVVQKKILRTVKNTFQRSQDLQERAEYFSSLFTANSLDDFARVWDRHIDELFVVSSEHEIDMGKMEGLQSSTYEKLQGEISKYEEIKERDTEKGDTKLSKDRIIKGYFSKNRENAHARMAADICLASDPNMLKNKNYFEFVLFDEERDRCMGTTMLLNIEDGGKKYLLYCPNPSVGLVSEVSAKKLFSLITKRITDFAEENGFDHVVVKKEHGQSTNRAGLFQQSLEQACLKDDTGQEVEINLKEKHTLGGGYIYQNGLRTVWNKK